MINSGLFFNRKLKVGDIYFDGHTSELFEASALPTQQPVEFGANIVDNIVIQPYTLEVVIFVGDIIVINLNAKSIFNNFRKTPDALNVLYQAMVERNTLDVVCNLGYFPGMAIVNINANTDTDTVTGVLATLTLQQILFMGEVSTNTPIDKQYAPGVNRGMLQPNIDPQ